MATTLVYGINVSLDGYATDRDGGLDWTDADESTHEFFIDLERDVETFVYGRRLYQDMTVWQGMTGPYADHWRSKDKVVISTTLTDVATPRTT
ncbi:MAG TPA: deaminase, partial [Microbacterium sp.]|nr:deaminase [Microbacterium sp.]